MIFMHSIISVTKVYSYIYIFNIPKKQMMSLSRDFGYILHKFLRDGCFFLFSRLCSQQYIYFYQKINWSSWQDIDPDEQRTGQRLLSMFVFSVKTPYIRKPCCFIQRCLYRFVDFQRVLLVRVYLTYLPFLSDLINPIYGEKTPL